jgi:hypothetical protein
MASNSKQEFIKNPYGNVYGLDTYGVIKGYDGRFITLNPELIVFNEHVVQGEHSCDTCKCSFCGVPSLYNHRKMENKKTGKSAGHMYCEVCLTRDVNLGVIYIQPLDISPM